MKKCKNFLFAAVCMCLFFLIASEVCAGEMNEGASNWTLSRLSFSHTRAYFELSGVERAQTATAVITSLDEEDDLEVRIEFSIKNATESFALDLPEDTYLRPNKTYVLTVYDEAGEEISKSAKKGYCYLGMDYGEINAYPNQVEVEFPEYSNITNVTVEVGFTVYEETISDGIIVIPYPNQELGTNIVLTFSDGYGCTHTREKKVENQYLRFPSIDVYPEALMTLRGTSSSTRLAVKCGEEIYYSEYGCGDWDWSTVVSYPMQALGTKVEVWLESKNGSVSDIETFTVSECDFDEYGIYASAYPEQMGGSVSANNKGQIPTKAGITIENKKYESVIQKDGSFFIQYPRQKDREKLIVEFSDAHGCCIKKTIEVYNDKIVSYMESYVFKCDVLPYFTLGKAVFDARLCAQIGGKIYYGAYTANRNAKSTYVSYPYQKPGTKIKVWYEKKNSSKSEMKEYIVPQRKAYFSIQKVTSSYIIFSFENLYAYYDNQWNSVRDDLEGCTLYINGKKSKAHLSKIDAGSMQFKATFASKVGDSVRFVLESTDGYYYEFAQKIPNVKPKITVNRINSGSKKITGKTVGGASVTIKAGKKKYTVTSSANGKFSVNIKPLKPGSYVDVKVNTKDGNHAEKTVEVKALKGEISLSKYVYRDSTGITCKITNARKGDKIKVKIGGSAYTKKIKSTKKKQKINISIKPESAGQTITLTYYDKYNNKKGSAKSMVYIGNTIYVGMSVNDVVLTTWGKPVRRNSYGSLQQWIFRHGFSGLYVYIQNGVVTGLQRFSY